MTAAMKAELRRRMRAVVASVGAEERASAALAVVRPLVARAEAGPVASFASMGNEINTAPLDAALAHGGIVRAYPQVVGPDLVFRGLPSAVRSGDLPRAAFGAPQPTVDFAPIALATCTLVVVPGLAFDSRGGRIGYGRGFYDRALSTMDIDRAVGLCFDAQIVEDVPMEAADVRLRWLCTPARGVFRVSN